MCNRCFMGSNSRLRAAKCRQTIGWHERWFVTCVACQRLEAGERCHSLAWGLVIQDEAPSYRVSVQLH